MPDIPSQLIHCSSSKVLCVIGCQHFTHGKQINWCKMNKSAQIWYQLWQSPETYFRLPERSATDLELHFFQTKGHQRETPLWNPELQFIRQFGSVICCLNRDELIFIILNALITNVCCESLSYWPLAQLVWTDVVASWAVCTMNFVVCSG